LIIVPTLAPLIDDRNTKGQNAMSTQTQAQVASTLGINVRALWSLSSNPQFPTPVSNDGAGNILWDAGAISTFAVLQTSAIGRGWKISTAALPTFDFNHASANSPGAHYRPAFADPLFDI
jgi:predicted DNA-binding transcriptional regulator AlpA